ncbi:MAG: leucine--tRNA ligase [Bacteroidetes bacterium GWF2_33_38]|nr:MAG: leucine--tRNA ligase [Bacteroidetes bacterium GWF2_33_38]OFY75208.1 MAG: leucine--tRNA ligase [Bacteroidetes bacterium RIFOXYA12_FULL_33_9]HBX52591.1 leucine--tRNA ligase [Bacteroidales bacterium]
MEYNFTEIEKNWQKFWSENKTFKAEVDKNKPKFYVLDMFPYPSGAGLHVGHPLGYIASDIYSRFKRLNGFNVLHPMGYDAFGLPAEQYAIQTGQHPAITTDVNIKRYRQQLDKIGFSYDWDREFRTCDADYYKWTQWAFTQMFNHYYDNKTNKAESIESLISEFEKNGNSNVNAVCSEPEIFSASEWKQKSENEKQEILLNYRIAYLADTMVNWCSALGTVLANDEVKDGLSVRGGHPVEQKKMRQWSLRISAYAERLLNGLDTVDWTDSLKEMQRNWIGKSQGAEIHFDLSPTLSKGKGARPEYMTTDAHTWLGVKEHVVENRKNSTEAEAFLWKNLKGKKLGYKIRRQHAIDKFIADFVCLEKKTIIEIDGIYHDFQKEQDEHRTQILTELGFSVIRFKNEEVFANPEKVLAEIKSYLDAKVLPFGEDLGGVGFTIFTTRPDTIFGCTFMVLAPESELVDKVTTTEYKSAIQEYILETKKRTERERMADVKKVSGQFTGAYAINPFTKTEIPIYISDYVLAGYGTGAIMAVPAHDSRDFKFAKHFNLPIIQVVAKAGETETDPQTWEDSYDSKDGVMINSGVITGMTVKDAVNHIIDIIENEDLGTRKVNYRLRDAIFSRQRYWGEPFPVYFKDGLPQVLDLKNLPLELPEVDKFLPTEDGQPPLGRAKKWSTEEGFPFELSTMPGFAGSSAYYLRYMDPKNDKELVSKDANNYWQDVDLYIGGTEHATGHLIYSRFWNKFLFDLGLVCKEEPFKKLINQGMIQGLSEFICTISGHKMGTQNITTLFDFYWLNGIKNIVDCNGNNINAEVFYSAEIAEEAFNNIAEVTEKCKLLKFNIPIYYTSNHKLVEFSKFKLWRDLDSPSTSIFVCKNGYWIVKGNSVEWIGDQNIKGDFHTIPVVEKMSKSKYNVVSPDNNYDSEGNLIQEGVIEKYGADTLRLYEMFLGPLEQSKPWDTQGIDGVHRFLKKLWRLFFDNNGTFQVSDEPATKDELKILHKTIKKIKEDIENFSFNTSVSAFMICVNELSDLKCNKREILSDLIVLVSSFAPHISEELWNKLGNKESISFAKFPEFKAEYLVENSFLYPISFNGKMRFSMDFPIDATIKEIETVVLNDERSQKWLEGKAPKKVIIVPKKIINIVF